MLDRGVVHMASTVLGKDMLSESAVAQFCFWEHCFLNNKFGLKFQGFHVDHQLLSVACGCKHNSVGHVSAACRVVASSECARAKSSTRWFSPCCGFQMISPLVTSHGTSLISVSDPWLVQKIRDAGDDVAQLARIGPVRRIYVIVTAGETAFLSSELVHGGPSYEAVLKIRATSTTAAGFPLCEGYETGLRQFVYCDATECKTRVAGRGGMYMNVSMDRDTYDRVLGSIDPKNCCTGKKRKQGCDICS